MFLLATLRARAAPLSTGETGAARAGAREAVERIVEQLRSGDAPVDASAPATAANSEPKVGARVVVGGLGMEGTIVSIRGRQAEIDVRGKRLRSPVRDLRVLATAPGSQSLPKVRVHVELKPREGSLSELNVIGCTVEEAVDRVAKFLDETLVTDQQEIRIVHGHGTGQLRKGLAAFLKDHPLVAKFYAAPANQGGGGATIVELKD